MIQSKEGSSAKVPVDYDDEPSGPYIPISECYTGKPVCFKGYPNSNPHLPPPPLPSCSSSTVHHPTVSHHPHALAYKQLPSSPGVHHHQVTNYDVPRSSVFTKVALPINSPASGLSSSSSNTLNCRKGKPHNLTVGPFSHTIGRHERLSDNNSTHSLRNRVTKPNSDFNHPNYRNEPPPRPPKPHKLNNRSKSESCSPAYGSNNFINNNVDLLSPSTSFNSQLDLPSSPGHHSSITSNLNTNNTNNNSNPVNNSNVNNTNNINTNNNNVNATHSNQHLINTPTSQPLTLDDVYDFPKSEPVFTSMRTPIPAPGNRATKPGNSHSYTNAPPGHLAKPPVFTYDYKGTLPVYLDDNTIAFELDNCDRSPSTPNSAFDSLSSSGSLSKSLTPPAVNRNLKPKRRDSDSDNNVSPTSPTFTLAPPPAHSKSFSKPTRHLNEVPPPRVPSRGRQFQHNFTRDGSNSDEDIVSHSSKIFHKRNSSLDDQSPRVFTVPKKSPSESPDVTYLDLDLKEKSDKEFSNSFDPCKSLSNHSKDLSETCNLSGSQSTVYKSIDFVATQAFRQLRISSQRLIEKE